MTATAPETPPSWATILTIAGLTSLLCIPVGVLSYAGGRDVGERTASRAVTGPEGFVKCLPGGDCIILCEQVAWASAPADPEPTCSVTWERPEPPEPGKRRVAWSDALPIPPTGYTPMPVPHSAWSYAPVSKGPAK